MSETCDIAVIGGGVAGLTAALFGARLGRSTLALVSLIPGGNLANIEHVEDFPGFPEGVAGYELGPGLQQQASEAGAEFRMAQVQRLSAAAGGWTLETDEGPFRSRAVIVASGSSARTLGVPGEERLAGKGVSHCASCDGPLLKDKRVVVVGAGDSGLQEALALAGLAAEVLVLDRDPQPAALETYRRRVSAHAKIRLLTGVTVLEVLGEAAVTGVRSRDASGRTEDHPAEGVFVYVGLEPNTAFLRELLPLDPAGRISTDTWMRTSIPGLLAAGDVRADSACQAVSAAGDGATAAIAAHRFLRQQGG